VARNQLKRRLRELVRTALLPGAPAADVVIRARREAYDAPFDGLAADVARAASQLGALAASGSLRGLRAEPRPLPPRRGQGPKAGDAGGAGGAGGDVGDASGEPAS
jgi:hypothetical protein